ncbi:MAG: regulatory iron-sulfur-containing complex subunit RicT [Thermodesulfovibrionales bacterium]
MPDVVGIRFKTCGKVYDFEVDGLVVKRGDVVVVESELGLSMGNVVVERGTLNVAKEFKKVLRKATDDDFNQWSENERLEEDAKAYCLERIMARGLPMKLISTEVTLDRKRIIFYFTAEGRIDFRELVKDLAAKFKTRIEMRQIGVRDEAKILGGFGICGRELCCRTFLTSFEPISIKMAKSQELVLNANKLSGACGRLMCCLGYEYNDNAESTPVSEITIPMEEEFEIQKESLPEITREVSKLPLQVYPPVVKEERRQVEPQNETPQGPGVPPGSCLPPGKTDAEDSKRTGGRFSYGNRIRRPRKRHRGKFHR